MPRRMPTRKPVQPKIPQHNIPGQSAEFIVHGSKYRLTRGKDEITIQAPKKPKVRYV